MAKLATPEQIEVWISSFEGTRDEAIDRLRNITIVPGLLRDRPQVLLWLAEQERLGRIEKETAEHEFVRRQTVAAERSADAAATSARWAIYSAVIACVALLATIWPYFKLVDALEHVIK
jgi:hypothetical protein